MMAAATSPEPLAKRIFVWTAGVALAAFIVVQVFTASRAGGPEARLEKLMVAIRAERIGQVLTPDLANYPLQAQSGKTLTLAQMPRDTLIFLNFWFADCPPCRAELPSMFELNRKLAGRRFQMVAVNAVDNWERVSDFFAEVSGRVPSPSELFLMRDLDAGDGPPLAERMGATGFPETYIVYNGVVLERFVGERDWRHPAIQEYFELRAPRR
ncbi:MAG: thiol-disulfide isomerase/thioredoxin [Myxococcota bacterium]|jgi:thiol-disulfide isomerase/thioredoxin